MWYNRGIGYGNDIVGRPVGSWDESTMEAYAEFVRPLMPAQAEPRAEEYGVDAEAEVAPSAPQG